MDLNSELKAAFKGALRDDPKGAWCDAWMPTGIIPLDHALYGGPGPDGGFGEGRTGEIHGLWSVGKTLALYHWLINVQMVLGGKSILFEAEGGFAPKWYQQLGGILDPKDKRTLLYYPDLKTVEDFFDGVMKVIQVIKKTGFSGPVAVGWDSIGATGTKQLQKPYAGKKQKQGDVGTRDLSKALAISDGTKLITSHLAGTRITVVATNHEKTGPGQKDWMPPNRPGGRAWPYHASSEVHLVQDGGPKGSMIFTPDGEIKLGRWVRGTIAKSKLGPPFSEFKLPIYTKAGFPHPTFEDEETRVGIDHRESLLEWYLGGEALFGEDRERYLTMGGAGRIAIHPQITGGEKVRGFLKKAWPQILAEYPHLMTMQPEKPGVSKHPAKKKKR